MERYKIGKNKIPISLPSNWQEVPFWKGLKIMEGGMSDFAILGLLADVDPKEIEQSTDYETVYYFLSAFNYLKVMPDLRYPEMPRSVKMGDDRVIFPFVLYQDKFDLGKCSVGQVKDMEATIKNMREEFIGDEDRAFTNMETVKMSLPLAAIYVQSIMDKGYDYDKAMKLQDRISKELSFKEVLNMGYFFLLRLTDLMSGSGPGWQRPNSIRRNLKRAWWSLIQRLVSILP